MKLKKDASYIKVLFMSLWIDVLMSYLKSIDTYYYLSNDL